MDPVHPAYDGAAVTGLVPALVGGRPAEWIPEAARDAASVVLLVLDGLGWLAIQEHAARLPVLAGLAGGPITTVAPSTTATALTSIATGLAPSQHGITGYRTRIDGSVVNMLTWHREHRRHPPDPFTVQRHAAFLGREVPVVTRSEYRNGGFTQAHLRGARFFGWSAVSTLIEHCARLAEAREPFVYAYYAGVDTVAHEFGIEGDFYRAELAATDELVGRLLERLPAHAALLVTADHGQVQVGPERWLPVGDVDDLVEACSGDGRFRYLHARAGAARELVVAAHERHDAHAWVLARDELLDQGWLGPTPSPATRRRVGDVVLAAREPVAFVDPALPKEARLVSAHGSLTADEMLVPLLAGRGGA